MAAKYRRIDPRFWKDEKIRPMTTEEKCVALYLFTGQSNRIGIFAFSPGEAAEDLGMTADRYAIRFRNVSENLSLGWDPEARVLYLPTWWKYNQPENPKHLKGCLKDLHDVPQTPLLAQFYSNTRYLSVELRDTFTYTLQYSYPLPMGIAMGKGSLYQEQEQEQKQEQEGGSGGKQDSPPSDEATEEWILDEWRKIPGVQQPEEITPLLRQTMRARIREHRKREWWATKFFPRVSSSDFLTGKTEEPFRCHLGWALGPKNFSKIIEGRYVNPVSVAPPGRCGWANGRHPCPNNHESGSRYCTQHRESLKRAQRAAGIIP